MGQGLGTGGMEVCPRVDVSYRNASHRVSRDSFRGNGDMLGE